ncbi:proline/glycine betaine ABC transporter permease [Paenibacillus sp. TRM 82003]|uniref:ABC transporter permease n=1 Tax=Kineococcus sp. TRM81007 TaxID=2925831 RepID=UPI001F592D9F|nr:proline/glycine betaine ABC transporter permease [Kineococcus sp. TRM81007]MCI2237100.1 proline/glycine betaine ABC transporter permease [Kineococcus sp. TRM81007]MCI3926429.1 proline/glycine betaine ABC transporter permease [Paenibacillus sp. TRM 82003]
MADAEGTLIPRIPVGDAVETVFDWVTDNFEPVFDAVSTATEWTVEGITAGLLVLPALVLAALLALLGALVRSVGFAVASFAGLLLVISMGLWTQAMQTLALILTAAVIATVIAVPVGVLAARNPRVSAVVKPVLDFMQTMPAFVYLVPAVVLFGIGLVPGVIVTVIFALPPGVRLTELGIRQVDQEVVEAGHAFGSSPWQVLRGIQLPLALPTIMAGINQVIMLALSMAVIAGLIGAEGLGSEVTAAISRLNIGQGVEAGLSVVVLAIYLDRLTASFNSGGGLLGRARARRDLEPVEPVTTTTA